MSDTPRSPGFGSHPESITAPGPTGQSYIFAIGIDQYRHLNPLHNAVRDVEKVVRLLTARFQFDTRHVTLLRNEEAKRSNIHREFRRLSQVVTPQDTVLIYYSGHGIEDNNDGYWIPVDGLPDDTASYVSNIEIINFLKKINSFHTLLISDSCFSGTLFSGVERRLTAKQRMETIPSRWAMTSGRKEPVSDGKPGENSPFADSLLLHLERNTAEVVPVSHLFDTVIEDVGSNARQLPRCEPLQDVGHRGGEFMFRLKNAKYEPTKPEYISPPMPTPNSPSPVGGSRVAWPYIAGGAVLMVLMLWAALSYVNRQKVIPTTVKTESAVPVNPKSGAMSADTVLKTKADQPLKPTPSIPQNKSEQNNTPNNTPKTQQPARQEPKPQPGPTTDDVATEAPVIQTFNVACRSNGRAGVRVWVSDEIDGKVYETVTTASGGNLRLPTSMRNKTVRVHFEQNGQSDYHNVKMNAGVVIELPDGF